jgi:hypothetical protein
VLTCITLTIGAFATTIATSEAAITNNTIGPTAKISGHGYLVRGTVLVACTSGQRVDLTLTIRQGDAVSTGRASGICGGGQKAYPVRTIARGDGAFEAGPATACATAANSSEGRIVDHRRWCRAGRITLFSP